MIILRSLLVTLLLVATGPVFAGGIYLGGSLGSQSDDFSKSGEMAVLNNRTLKPMPNNIKTVSGIDSAGGVVGEVELGYRQTLSKRFSLGLEADFSAGSADVKLMYPDTDSGQTNRADESVRFSLGASVLPAVRLGKNAVLFARAGLGMSQIKLNSDGYMYNLANYRTAIKDDEYAIFGLGMNIKYTRHWGFRIEGDYLRFSPFTLHDDRFDESQSEGQHQIYDYDAEYKPHAMRALVGLIYTF